MQEYKVPPNTILLTVVTVTFNDPVGLLRTISSMSNLPEHGIQHVIVDGGSDRESLDLSRSLATTKRMVIVERDEGIYDAMNKGLKHAVGEYVVFMNGGDEFHPQFQLPFLLKESRGQRRVLLGYSVEVFGRDRYLTPGLGKEAKVFASPSHQATFYPKAFYLGAKFDKSSPVSADGKLTREALKSHGGIFVPTVVCFFHLGGLSTSYGDLAFVVKRVRELHLKGKALVLMKAILWRLLPQRTFYRLLASYKYTRISDSGTVSRDFLAAPVAFEPVTG